MKFYYILIFFFLLSGGTYTVAQPLLVSKDYPQTDFRPPLNLTPSLAGCFGEIRSGHFHSGLDYRTNFRQGYPVYAVADGYVSRIKVQIGGFGNAVYITHPNGYTSVYAHLQRFNDKITRLLRQYQFDHQTFAVDFPLLPVEALIKKGEIIAWSGNTGSVAGPHLHFEIRDTKTEETLNPQLFGFDIPDHVKPVINGLYVYRLNGLPFDENTPRQYFRMAGYSGKYHLYNSPVISISGETGFGVMTYDQEVPGGNKNGIYSIELLVDGQTIYASTLEGFFFQNSRAVNSHIDYPLWRTTRRVVQKSFVDPGNPLTIYKTLINRGLITPGDDKIHEAEYIIRDAKGNTSTLSFKIKYSPGATKTAEAKPGTATFYYDRNNEFSTETCKINIPKGVLYNNLNFRYSETAKPSHSFSKVYHIHTSLIPLHTFYDLWIKPDSTLSPGLYSKALIVDSRGISQGGEYDNGYIKASPRVFGNFHVTVDTLAPVIHPVHVWENKTFKTGSKMIFKISDNLSGIADFKGFIDGKWILMEYDLKTDALWHTFDDTIPAGKHLFQLTVTDNKANTKTYTATIYR